MTAPGAEAFPHASRPSSGAFELDRSEAAVHGPGEADGMQTPDRLCPRRLFPLPLPAREPEVPRAGRCRAVQRRGQRAAHAGEWVESCVQALNEMDAGRPVAPSCSGRPSLAQRQALEHLVASERALGPPPSELTGAGALAELRAHRGYGAEHATLAPLDISALSLPPAGSQPVPLERLLEPLGSQLVEGFIKEALLPREEARRRWEEAGLRAAYSDPSLKKPQKYGALLRRLAACNMITYKLRGTPRVGIFAVWKKEGKQRLIADARLSNCCFGPSAAVELATGQALGSLEVDGGGPVCLGLTDIANAFYFMKLPPALQDYFGLAPVAAGLVGETECEGAAVAPADRLWPHLNVLPMGWTHALWWCQLVHEAAVSRCCGLGLSTQLRDRAPPPPLDPVVHAEYVDNFTALSRSLPAARGAAEAVHAQLEAAGLPTHGVESSVGGDTLGWSYGRDLATFSPSARRVWRWRYAAQELLRRGWASPDDVRSVLGHATFMALCRRELLSCFSAAYAFAQQGGDRPRRLWAGVRRELRWFGALLALARRRLDAPWSPEVSVVDASL